jgi:hypothetical protein
MRKRTSLAAAGSLLVASMCSPAVTCSPRPALPSPGRASASSALSSRRRTRRTCMSATRTTAPRWARSRLTTTACSASSPRLGPRRMQTGRPRRAGWRSATMRRQPVRHALHPVAVTDQVPSHGIGQRPIVVHDHDPAGRIRVAQHSGRRHSAASRRARAGHRGHGSPICAAQHAADDPSPVRKGSCRASGATVPGLVQPRRRACGRSIATPAQLRYLLESAHRSTACAARVANRSGRPPVAER